MTFLETQRILREFKGGPTLDLLLAGSGTFDPITLFLKAAAAKAGHALALRTLPFNTLQQHLLAGDRPEAAEVIFLLPWDLAGEADWRSGIPAVPGDLDTIMERAAQRAALLAGRRVLYLPAALPPLFADPADDRRLAGGLMALALSAGAHLLPTRAFAMGAYLASGCPLGGDAMASTAQAVIEARLAALHPPKKVLVTDLDNVMWQGVIGEAGLDGIAFAPEGRGYPHFIYQTLLKRLKAQGVILAAVSRNDPADALAPFRGRGMALAEDDFVAILASYNPKSAQVAELARELSLGLDSFVFVDDNPVELAEVHQALPQVTCLAFPERVEEKPLFLERLSGHFATRNVTEEDRKRTDMYRSRMAGLAPSSAKGADLTAFLRGLGMEMTVHSGGAGGRERAVQLINKTNQFNLNGIRFDHGEVAGLLAAGGRLYTATLRDHHGDHGEILACLTDGDGLLRSLVMSCRVLQRRVERVFLAHLAQRGEAPTRLDYRRTDRNEPLRNFLEEIGLPADRDGVLDFDPAAYLARFGDDLELMRVHVP